MTVSSTDENTGGDAGEELQDVNAAESSQAEANEGVGSLLDAIEAGLKPEEATPASDEQEPEKPEPGAAEQDDEPSEDEKKTWSERTQRRFRDLVEGKKAAEAAAEPLRQELETVKPKAERYEQLSTFMRENRIEEAHLNNALGLTSLINKGDFDRAVPVLESLLEQCRQRRGDILPDDLRQQVDLGYITEGHAKELNRARASEKRAREQSEQAQQAAASERSQRELDGLVRTVTTAADAWHQEKATSDPDWNLKRDLVVEQMELSLRRGGPESYPRSVQATRELLDKVLQDVEKRIGVFRPAPRPITPTNGGHPSPRSVAKPANMLEAIEQGLAEAQNG